MIPLILGAAGAILIADGFEKIPKFGQGGVFSRSLINLTQEAKNIILKKFPRNYKSSWGGKAYNTDNEYRRDGAEIALTTPEIYEANGLVKVEDCDDAVAYDMAKLIFEQSEGRKPDMNNVKDMGAVSAIQLGYKSAKSKEYRDWKKNKS